MTYQPNNYIEEMLLALEANIEYLRQEGYSQLWVKNGQFLNSVGDNHIYEFTLEYLQNIDPDTDVEVRISNESVNGRVIAISERNIQIALERHVGPTIPQAKLIISSYYLLQLLCEKLKEVKNGNIRLSDLAEKTFKLKPAQVSLAEDYQIADSSVPHSLNPSQQEALRLALGSEVSFIWGPPGTGKTKTIAGITEEFFAQDKSVLLIAHTNVATDHAMKGVVEHLGGKSNVDYCDGKLLREGNIQMEGLKEYEMVILANVLEVKGRPIKYELDKLTKEHERLCLIVEKSEKIVKHFELIEKLKRKEADSLKTIYKEEQAMKSAHEMQNVLESQLVTVEQNITKCQSFGTLRRLLSGLNLDELVKEKNSLLVQKERVNAGTALNARAISSLKTRLQRYSLKKANWEKEVQDVDLGKHQNIVESTRIELRILTEQIDSLQKQLEELENNIIKEAKIIATTLTKSYSSKVVLNREYDCVILDEASMAPLPALWYASGLAKQNVVIVGDFYQLPPIAKHKVLHKDKTDEEIKKEESLVERWLKKDIFEFVKITDAIETGKPLPDWLQQLKTQYGMHPDIANVINSLIYERKGRQYKLDSAEGTETKGRKRLQVAPLENAHVGIYDTSTIGSLPSRTDSGSYYNLYHAFLSVEIAKQAIESGYERIAIISPFRAQTNLLQKVVEDENLVGKVEANTVHRFQGTEKEIIVFDLTTPQSTKLTDDQEPGGDDEKLLNVAFSRAEEKFIVVADVRTIEEKHSASSLMRGFINYCRLCGFPVISCGNVLPVFSVTDKTEEWLEKIYNIESVDDEIEASSLFDETDFYQKFFEDLFNAKKEVIIDSPYITSKRVDYCMPIFNLLVSKGVNIFILTRQPKEHSKSMKYQAKGELECFESLGITVLPFQGRLRRKLAIIDRDILWEGSLNILSQKDSKEVMRRSHGEATAQQMMRFLRLDANIGKIGENKLKRCEMCNEPGAWYWTGKSRYGLWTFCLVGGHKKGEEPKSREEKKKEHGKIRDLRKSPKKRTSEGVPICENQEKHKQPLPMVKKKGRFGEFWGCQEYPKCKNTEKIHT
jgi:hypothetical protein